MDIYYTNDYKRADKYQINDIFEFNAILIEEDEAKEPAYELY